MLREQLMETIKASIWFLAASLELACDFPFSFLYIQNPQKNNDLKHRNLFIIQNQGGFKCLRETDLSYFAFN